MVSSPPLSTTSSRGQERRPEPQKLAPLYHQVPTVLWPSLNGVAAMTIGALVDLERVEADALAREARLWRHDPDRAVHAGATVASGLLEGIEASVIGEGTGVAVLVRYRAETFLAGVPFEA